MMVRFSCFPTHIHYQRTKKDGHQCSQENDAQETAEDSPVFSSDEALQVTSVSATSILHREENVPSNTHTSAEQITSPSSFECCWKSEELNDTSYPGDEIEILQGMGLKKSQSLGSGLDREGRFSCNVETDDEIDQGLPSNNFQDEKFGRLVNLFDNSGLQDVCAFDDVGINLLNRNQENIFGINGDPVSNDSIFSIGNMKLLDNKFCEVGEEISPYHVVELDHKSTLHTFSKSHSLPCLGICESSPACRLMQHRSRSFENLCTVDITSEHFDGGLHSRTSLHQYSVASPCHDMSQTSDPIGERVHSEEDLGDSCVISSANKECKEVSDNEKYFMTQSRNHTLNSKFNDDYTAHNLSVSLDDEWRETEINGINDVDTQLEEASGKWHELSSKNFNIKRVEEWIRQIDIHDSVIVQEVGESSSSIPKRKKDPHPISGVNASKPYAKGSGGVEAAYNYISSLVPSSTSAQMTNLGLVVIPFLSAFSSLRVLNLSGNAIVKITSGALPRGLHMLNLSRNNISTIEGLRELTRLRVLVLSYNRIVRIGHGLAGCSSLKELYLAGNKISEVDGLHRLLKLNVLDLGFNKISTAKCLGQLAANYGSLQAINLEGNPAQRNVGEEQLKRYLLGLLPHLVYFNKHIVRASLTKELSDRPSRSATSHQLDRGTRLNHKRSRRGSNSATSHKVASSSNHARLGQAVAAPRNLSSHRDRHAHLPPAGSKIHHLPRIGSKLFSGLRPINPIRRSRSEGNL